MILTSQAKQVIKAGVIDCLISDHDIIFTDLLLKASRPKVTYVKTRSFKNYNPDAFQYDMSFAPWSVLEIFDNVDDKLHAFDLLLMSFLTTMLRSDQLKFAESQILHNWGNTRAYEI